MKRLLAASKLLAQVVQAIKSAVMAIEVLVRLFRYLMNL